jgi:hypothetical protein
MPRSASAFAAIPHSQTLHSTPQLDFLGFPIDARLQFRNLGAETKISRFASEAFAAMATVASAARLRY